MDQPIRKSSSIRVNRLTGALVGRGGEERGNPIRVSRKRVRPVRINSPTEGANLQLATAYLSGTANPGDTLRLDFGGSEPVTCLVKPDGSWDMRDVWLPPGNRSLTVVNKNHPTRTATVNVVVSDLQQIAVIAPLQGETMEARFVEITG